MASHLGIDINAKLAELRAAKVSGSLENTSAYKNAIATNAVTVGIHTPETHAIANEIDKTTSIDISAAVSNLQTKAALIPEAPIKHTPNSIDSYVLHEAIANLQNLILTAHPTLPVLLRTIHKQLRDDAELVTILSEEEVGIIVNGLKKVTNTEIAASTVKSSTTAKLKKKGNLNVDMF